jgi:hypothetical protein
VSGYRTWSTAKSITAALLGIAAHKGLLELDAPAAIPEWQFPGDPRQKITYEQLNVTVVPDHDLVIVRTGVDPIGMSWLHEWFVAEIISQLDPGD